MSFQVQKIRRSETVEIVINNVNSRQYKFSDNETTLDTVVLQGIAVHTEALVKSFSGKTILPTAEIKKGFLTLSTPQSATPFKRYPLESFFQNSSFITFFEDTVIDFRKSYIDFPNSAALVLPVDGLGFAVVTTILYKPLEASQKVGVMGDVLNDY
ncbi:MAG: hypothetical protein H7320_13110 [Ferruginibacter sp.]|nr:hypothetical protein [Ferruginibacter sp.]